jgi:molybdate transport system substrate-binding protein
MGARLRSWLGAAALVALTAARPAAADSATIAVAANFLAPLQTLEKAFEQTGRHELVVVSGSTGQLYAQITNGAPFDVLLAADQATVTRLVAEHLADDATRFTYAVGTLALFTRASAKFAPLTLDSLRRTDFRWLAIANPELAPYGLAARQTLETLGLWETLQPRLVRGQSIAQTFALAETRNADLAFVALSQVVGYREPATYVTVPEQLHAPLRQDAVTLRHGHDNVAAHAFLTFLRGAAAAQTIAAFGYRPGAP